MTANASQLPQEKATLNELTARLGGLARRAITSESLLKSAVELVIEITGAKTCGLYLCNTSLVAASQSTGGEVNFVSEAILLESICSPVLFLPDRIEFEDSVDDLGQILNRAYLERSPDSDQGPLTIIPFRQDKTIRGAVAILHSDNISDADKVSLAESFDEFCIMLELVTDRYLQKTLVELNAKALMLLSEHPHHCMCGILREAGRIIGCDGISFFALDPYDDSEFFHLVGTYPNPMPTSDIAYSKEQNTLTSKILDGKRDCVVHYPILERSQLDTLGPPKWKDVPSDTKSETVIYVRLAQSEETVALLRCTNRHNKTLSHWFNWIDVRRAKSLASLLLPYYKAAQKEDRFSSSLSDISHEIKSMSGGIGYTAQNIRDQLLSLRLDSIKIDDVILKLGHIELTSKRLRRMLPALRLEASIPSSDTPITKRNVMAFRPYADLCKPIAEMHIHSARKRHISIEHFGQDQLGLIYADIEDFKHVLGNLITNAVKYTDYGTPIYIRYERPSSQYQFARIHIASESLSIRPDESEFIFKYRQRAVAAKNSNIEGEGIGLAIARAKARQYSGDVVYKSDGNINIFSVLIPRSLFHTPT